MVNPHIALKCQRWADSMFPLENILKSMLAQSEVERKAAVGKVKAIFAFDIKVKDKVESWYVDMKNGGGAIGRGNPKTKADMIVSVSDDDFVQLASGKLNPQKAFMSGKIKVKGNVGLASKLESVLKAKK